MHDGLIHPWMDIILRLQTSCSSLKQARGAGAAAKTQLSCNEMEVARDVSVFPVEIFSQNSKYFQLSRDSPTLSRNKRSKRWALILNSDGNHFIHWSKFSIGNENSRRVSIQKLQDLSMLHLPSLQEIFKISRWFPSDCGGRFKLCTSSPFW